jgi:hypothetical protein
LLEVGDDGLQRGEVAVNVGDERKAHGFVT